MAGRLRFVEKLRAALGRLRRFLLGSYDSRWAYASGGEVSWATSPTKSKRDAAAVFVGSPISSRAKPSCGWGAGGRSPLIRAWRRTRIGKGAR